LLDEFVPNDAHMDQQSAWVLVITGPNMAGKSTYIRQIALLVLLAQIGSFVPAAEMELSLADRIFARVGASDEIMRGQSTFMVEMTEAANILHNATADSLIVLDELGRGTSTFDGLSLAWAITEHLATETRCRCLVATHYHELTELAELLKGVRNYNVAVRQVAGEKKGEDTIVFLHRIVEGGASESYGIHVARLAGVPRPVVTRSREILEELQRGFSRESRTPQLARKKTRDDAQLMLFKDPGEEILEALRDVEPDDLAPLEALQRLKEWKERFGG
jgi:DNA mismatch repair protein MutS